MTRMNSGLSCGRLRRRWLSCGRLRRSCGRLWRRGLSCGKLGRSGLSCGRYRLTNRCCNLGSWRRWRAVSSRRRRSRGTSYGTLRSDDRRSVVHTWVHGYDDLDCSSFI